MDECFRVSHYNIAKEMSGILDVNYDRTTKLKRDRMNSLTSEYKLFRIKSQDNIPNMHKCVIHIVNHLRTIKILRKLINKVFRCLNHI